MAARDLTPADGVRPARIHQTVHDAVRLWRRRQGLAAAPAAKIAYPPAETILQPLPRRERPMAGAEPSEAGLPSPVGRTYSTSVGASLRRLLAWLELIVTLLLGNGLDWLLRRGSEARQAVRLRQALERAGATFVKIGQQAAMRIDLLPWTTCVELSKMLDQMQPFPVERAFEAIARTTGRPWPEIFAVFDPEPIGSASIACVYQAVLHDGTRVAVKVRRPGIAAVFSADLHVLDWLSGLAEFLTVFRPGFTHNLRSELRDTLLEELDFRREARFQDTFRRNAKKSGRSFFTAPRVYFQLSGEEVLVQEFVSGLWLWEVLAAVEQKDPRALALLRQRNIDPLVVARRILWTSHWSMSEHVFFHADPHPANILVREDNQLTFVDFGSCGSLNAHQRAAIEQMMLSMQAQDTESMTLATLNLMEPLPPVDLPAMVQMARQEYMTTLHAFDAPPEFTQYWERTSARQWVVLIQIARKFNLSLNLHMLRMIRATLLYDTIVLRLDHELDRYDEYIQFLKDRSQLVGRRWRAQLRETTSDRLLLRAEELGHSLNDLLLRAQSTLGRPIVELGSTVDKWVFALSTLSRLAARLLLLTLLGLAVVAAGAWLGHTPIDLASALLDILRNPLYELLAVGLTILNLRHILFRLRERDTAR